MFRSFILAAIAAAALPAFASAAQPARHQALLQPPAPIILAAQKNGGSRSAGYSCSGLQCTCQGDADCNDMFSDGVCGDVASCDNDTGICKCLILKKTPPKTLRPDVKGKLPLLNSQ